MGVKVTFSDTSASVPVDDGATNPPPVDSSLPGGPGAPAPGGPGTKPPGVLGTPSPDGQEAPPMGIAGMAGGLEVNAELQERIDALVDLKVSPAYTALSLAEQQRVDELIDTGNPKALELIASLDSFIEDGALTRADLLAFIATNAPPVGSQGAMQTPQVTAMTAPQSIGKGIDAADFTDAVREAHTFVHSWLAGRSKGFSGMVYGPNVDGTYFYRMADRGTNGWGMEKAALVEARENLVDQGFPRMQFNELRFTNITSYLARRDGVPDGTRLCIKHFPGGDEALEVTEEQQVQYRDVQQVQGWMQTFRDIIALDEPPETVMIAHSSYTAAAFGEHAQVEQSWLLEGVPFDEIPASLNPGIISYLREELGFAGTLIGDWYNMHSIEQFVDPIAEKVGLSRDLVVFMLAAEAGMEIIPAVSVSTAELKQLEEKYPERYAELVNTVDESLVSSFYRLSGDPDLEIDLSSLTVYERVHLRTDMKLMTEAEEADDQAVIALLETQTKDGSGDVWNRTGVITLLTRQKVVEALSGQTFAAAPKRISDEGRWFDELMGNAEFRKVYDTINWEAPVTQRLYEAEAQRLLAAHRPADS